MADSPLTARKLGETRCVIVASPGYLARRGTPVAPEDLHDHKCLHFDLRRAEPVWPFRREGVDLAMAVRGNIEGNNGETLGQLALAGVDVARFGAFSVAGDLAPDASYRCSRTSTPATWSRTMRYSWAVRGRRRACGPSSTS